jgi:CubicO group peptidase (beta-lactamase class C family)
MISTNQIDKIFSRFPSLDAPGCAVSVIQNGEVIHKAGYGSAQLEYDIPITPQTVFHVASVSKQFTCYAIITLAQRGQLSLDDDIRKHIPELHDFGHTITIRHLAHHTSGIRDQWTLLNMAGWRQDDVITKAHILKLLYSQRDLNFEPGSAHLYCNSGYSLLAEIVERVSGLTFREFLHKEVFEPLEMATTHVHDNHQEVVPARSYSYQKGEDGRFENRVLSFANHGATSLFTTVEDLARWMLHFEKQHAANDEKILQLLHRDPLNNGKEISYGFGLTVNDWRGVEQIQHSGSDAGFRSHLLMIPQQRFGVAVLSNRADSDPSNLSHLVAASCLEEQLSSVLAPKPRDWAEEDEVALTDVDVSPILGRYYFIRNIFEIEQNDGKLSVRLESGDRLPLTKALGEFQNREHRIRIQMPGQSTGECLSIPINFGPHVGTARRIVPSEISNEDRDAYLGTYVSRELETRWRLLIEDDRLIARHQRHPDLRLRHIATDTLLTTEGYFQHLEFTRTDGRIDGFHVDGGGDRVQKLRFDLVVLPR